MDTWVVLIAYDIKTPPTAEEGKPDPHKDFRARQNANRDALEKWCTDGTSHARYSESAYAVHLVRGDVSTTGEVWELLVTSLPHELQSDDTVVVQELCGPPDGMRPPAADGLGFRAAPASPPIVNF